MASKKDGGSIIDFVAIAVSPALIMMMLGSLVFFLIEVIYRGAYPSKLVYTFFFYTIGIVLVARITIEQGRSKSLLYAAGLSVACMIAMMSFIEYPDGIMKILGPLLNIGLMAMLWWIADVLTWDCTHFDDARKASGKGVLAAVGLDDMATKQPDADDEEEATLTTKQQKLGWLERLNAYREARKKLPHTPGTRVLYFALGALPLFALGQSLIPAEDAARRSATFYQMAMYIGSSLALLVTTNLMGLRRYLADRGAKISPVQTTAWFVLGGGLILLFLVAGAILPRPHSETPLVDLGKNRSSNRNASDFAPVKDSSAGKGEGAAGKKTEAGAGKNSAKGGEQKGGNSGEKGSGGGKGESSGGNQSSQGDKSSSGDKPNPGESSKSKDQQKSQSKGGPNNAKSGEKNGQKGKAEQKDESGQGEGEKSEDAENKDENDSSSSSSEKSSPTTISKLFETLGSFLEWVIWIIIAIAFIVGLIYFFVKWLAPFTNWAKGLLDWWHNLWKRKAGETTSETTAEAQAEEAYSVPFSAFSNPFAGSAKKRTASEVVEYSFAALEAWAREHKLARQPHETPTEFATRLGHAHEDLDEPAFGLAQLYLRAAYSPKPIAKNELAIVVTLWDELQANQPSRR
ncbi:MAG: DUF4129 domain-containing protein [Fimbriiglobus sp.]